MSVLEKYLGELIRNVISDEFYPKIRVIRGCSTSPEVVADGKDIILMCSPNYLSLADHPEVKLAGIKATTEYGAGTVGSAFATGYLDLYQQLENLIADWMGSQSALVYNSTTLTTMGVMQAVMDPIFSPIFPGSLDRKFVKRAILIDYENHASIQAAVRLPKIYKVMVYKHNDMKDLEEKLKWLQEKNVGIIAIVTDGYFSMSATLAPLDKIVNLAKRYKTIVVVDDAHAVGVYGKNGTGTPDMFGVTDYPDLIQIGSLAKGFGVRGGFTHGKKDFIKYLRFAAKTYIFSGTLPAHVPAAVIASLNISFREPWRRKKVMANAEYLRKGIKKLGYSVLGEGHIIPWFIGDDNIAVKVSNILEEKGIFGTCIRFPAVAKRGIALIRFIPMAAHKLEHLDKVLNAIEYAGKICEVKYNII